MVWEQRHSLIAATLWSNAELLKHILSTMLPSSGYNVTCSFTHCGNHGQREANVQMKLAPTVGLPPCLPTAVPLSPSGPGRDGLPTLTWRKVAK